MTTGDILATANTGNPLLCDEYKTFWINFKQGEGVHMGYGADVSDARVVYMQDSSGWIQA